MPKSDKRKADVIREAFDAWQAGEYGEPTRYGVSGEAARDYVAAYLGREPRDADEAENTVKTIQRGFRKLLTKPRS